jgi:hypothetical protein
MQVMKLRGYHMKTKSRKDKMLLAFRIIATLFFVGILFYSLSFRMQGNDAAADLILTRLFVGYCVPILVIQFYKISQSK